MPNVIISGDPVPSIESDAKYALIVTNIGYTPTTVSHMIAYGYKSKWHRYLGKPNHNFIVKNDAIPQRIEVNDEWTGLGRYNDEFLSIRDNEALYVGVIATHRRKPYLIHLQPTKSQTDFEPEKQNYP